MGLQAPEEEQAAGLQINIFYRQIYQLKTFLQSAHREPSVLGHKVSRCTVKMPVLPVPPAAQKGAHFLCVFWFSTKNNNENNWLET